MLAMMLGIVAANAQGTGTVVVADGTTTNNYVPVYGSYTDDFLRCQTIYPESMLTDIAGSEIQGLTYYMSSAASPWSGSFDGTFVIKLGTTTKTAFESGDEWIDVTSFTTVYEGSIDFSASATVVINFGTTYTYTGGNLVIEVGQTSESSGYASTSFYGTSTTGASLQYYNGTSFAQIVGTVRNFMPKTGFIVPVSCGTPAFGTIVPSETTAIIPINEPNSATSWSFKYNDGVWTTITDNPYTLTGLTANTNYTVYVRSICGAGDTSMVATANFRTPCATEAFPYSEDFESYTAGSGNFPECWTSISGTNYVEANGTYSTYASQGTKALHMQGPGTVATPVINIAGNDVFISFDMKCENVNSSGDMAIGVALSPAMAESAIWIDTIDAATTYNRYEYTYRNTLNIASGCIVFKQVNTTSTNYYYWIDSLTVVEPPACAKPVGLTLDEATDRSLTLSWTENGTATKWVVKVGDGVWTETTENPYTIDGLTANTGYTVSVRAFCDPDTSDAVSGTFRTLCAIQSTPYTENFTDYTVNEAPSCWTTVVASGTYPKIGNSSSSATDGNYLELFGSYSSHVSFIATPILDRNANALYLSFDAWLSSYTSDTLYVGVIDNPGDPTTFTSVFSLVGTQNGGSWVNYEINLSAEAAIASSSSKYIAFRFYGSSDYCRLDNIVISEPPSCAKPTNFNLDAATDNSLTLSWTEAGSATKWVVKVDDGAWTETTENPYTINGLTANTEYAVSVRAFCDPDTSDAVNGTFRTLCVAEVVTTDDSFEEEFEGITSGIPSCWAQTDAVWESYTTGYTGRGLYFTDYYSGEDTLITPEFNFTAMDNGAQLSFWYKMPEAEDWYGDTYSATLEVLYRASTSGEWTVGETLTEAVEDWTKYELFLPSSTNAASYQIAFRAVSSSGYTSTYVYLDGVVVTTPPACPKPSALTLDAATETSLTLSWTENGSATKWVVKVDDGAWTETTENPYTINGLTANTEYAVTVRSFCDPDTSEAVSGTFRTACGIETLPYAENFESTIDCWEQEAIAGTNTWVLDDNYYTAYEGSHYLAFDNGYDQERRIISPVINLTGAENVTLTFAHAQATWGSDQDSLKVEYRLSETDEWHVLATYTTAIPSWQVENLSIEQTSATFQFAFHGYSNYGRPIAIDSVSLTSGTAPQPTCDVPTALAAGNVTANSAVISWTGSAAQYEVEFNGQSSTVATNSYNATGLTAATDYAVRVRALCDGGLTSDWTAMVNFTTLDNGGVDPEPCGVPTNVAVSNVTTNSAVVTWEAPAQEEGFEGEWNLEMGDEDSVHTTITMNSTLHMVLPYVIGHDIDDVDEEVSVAGTQVPVSIEQGAGNQMNISGNFDMMMYGVDEPVTFHFSTTGTVTENGMNIEPANISESVAIMGTMNIDYTGTVTFEQPTELPEDGVLTIGIASMNITGYGDTVIYGQTGTVSISMTASDIEATGMRAGAGNSEPTYEVMITNTASGVENTYASATRTYSAEGLTAATAYTAKVRTVCGEGNYSEWSTAVPFTTLNGDTPVECDVPTNVATSNVTATSVTVSWTGTASEYQIEVSDGGATPITITVSASPYTVEGLTAATNYTVRVRALCEDDETSDWSASASFTTLDGGEPGPQGIDDVNASYSVSVYPNPATNNVTVSVDGLTGKAQVSVIDMSGRTVMTSTMESDATQLNVSKLAQGTYFVRINGENISTVHKLVVK